MDQPGAQIVLDSLKNEWEIAQCLPSPGIDFSAVNCHTFPENIPVTVLEKYLEKTLLLETLPVAMAISQKTDNLVSAFTSALNL